MARRHAAAASSTAKPPDPPPDLIGAGLDALSFGFAIFDQDLMLVSGNRTFGTLRGYPEDLCRPGTAIGDFFRFNARRGDYGPGDEEDQVRVRLERLSGRQAHEIEYEVAAGRMLNIRYVPIARGGLVLTYSDITERKRAEQEVVHKEAQLHVALDNMSGALAYTDVDLKIVLCNNRFAEMYAVPRELLQPGRSYADFLRHLAEQGYYGDGDVAALVARRVESLRNPTGVPFEDRTPDGRIYEVNRRRAVVGGTVTVITEITTLKRAEERAERQQAQLHVALDNMPGALAYTDDDL
jgi:PAS domain-containing protein